MHVCQESIFSYTLCITIKHENKFSEENSNARKKCNDYEITHACVVLKWIELEILVCLAPAKNFFFNVAET